MQFIFCALLGLISSVSARCGTPQPSENIKSLHAAYQAAEAAAATKPRLRRQASELFGIDVYINVIVAGISEEDGVVPQSHIDNQVR